MSTSVFPRHTSNALSEPMFLGSQVNVARYDRQKYPHAETLTEKQISQFWRPEEIDLSRDRLDYMQLTEHEKHIFISNLKYQTLLDSVQGRSPGQAFMELISLPELEVFIDAWQFFESIHSRSYTHILRNIVNEPSEVFESIMTNEAIMARTEAVTKYYDDLIAYAKWHSLLGYGTHEVNGETLEITECELKRKLYLCLMCVNILEAVRFYVSFACSFAFAERKVMEGNAKIIKLIARDEAVHLSFTQFILNKLRLGDEGEEWKQIAQDCELESINMFYEAAEQEKAWADYLFKDGSMVGLNRSILHGYVEYITNARMTVVGLPACFITSDGSFPVNPIPWINNWLASDNVQVAPQEVEISSYLIGQIDADIDMDALGEMEI